MKYELITYVNGEKTGTVGFKSLKDLSRSAEQYGCYHAIHLEPAFFESPFKSAWNAYTIHAFIWTRKA